MFSFHSAKLQRITGKAGRWITDCITSITDIILHASHPTFPLQADQENQPLFLAALVMMMEKPISNSSKSLVQNLPSIKMYMQIMIRPTPAVGMALVVSTGRREYNENSGKLVSAMPGRTNPHNPFSMVYRSDGSDKDGSMVG